jgi:4-hydroxy-3-methylbut-2-enyl diphosphate reductase
MTGLAVLGVGVGLTDDLRAGDLVVGSEVSDGRTAVSCPSAALLAGELRRAGLLARVGPIVTVDHLTRPGGRPRPGAGGAIAADPASAALLSDGTGRPSVAVSVIGDPRSPDPPGSPRGGAAAQSSLRLAEPALARWAAACQPRRVLLAAPRSFCAGVERAIEIVELALDKYGPPVYVRKQIVHNAHVVARLEQLGAIFVAELSEVPPGATVVFSAHGVSPDVRRDAVERGHQTVDATCPLVAKVHAEARRFALDGFTVALIGHAGHEEVEGTLGEAPSAMTLIETAADVVKLRPDNPAKVAYLMQTTLAVDEATDLATAIKDRFPAARGPGSDDICYATTNRQAAIRAIASDSDLVLVVGSANSSNSVRLVETAQRAGTPAYLVDGREDIELGWLAGASTIGLTAGASAPPAMVDQIVEVLSGLGEIDTKEVAVATESIQFGLPKELRLHGHAAAPERADRDLPAVAAGAPQG